MLHGLLDITMFSYEDENITSIDENYTNEKVFPYSKLNHENSTPDTYIRFNIILKRKSRAFLYKF